MMNLLRKLRLLVLVFAVLAVVFGFTVLSTPNTANAIRCTAWCMYCTIEPPIICWCECCGF